MENFHHSAGAPLEANWFESSSASGFDDTFLVPRIVPPYASASASASTSTFQVSGFPPWSMPVQEAAQDRAASISKSHSQAEKRRRDRINAQLGILRKLIPKSDKMDKAALLGSVIDQVKELKRKATEVSKAFTVPTEIDEVNVDSCGEVISPTNVMNQDKDNKMFIRASLCCDDRPELFSELIRVLKGLRLGIVRADIASVGGRVKSIFVLCDEDSAKEGQVVSPSTVKQSLNAVLSRISSSSSVQSNYRIRSKRQRFFLPSSQ